MTDNNGSHPQPRTTVRAWLRCVSILLLACGPAVAEDETQKLSLHGSVILALERNLSLQIDRIDPIIAQYRLFEAKAEFDSVFEASTEYLDSERFPNNVLETSPQLVDGKINEERITPRVSMSGKSTGGAEYEMSLTTPVINTDHPLRLFDESYTPRVTVSVSQPLLRDSGKAVNRVRIEQAQNLGLHAVLELKVRILQLIHEVEEAYWATVRAQEHFEIAQESLELAESLVQRLAETRDSGLATDFDLLRPKLATEKRRADVARAAADMRNSQARLRGLINPELGVSTFIEASHAGIVDEPPGGLVVAVESALTQRLEIRQQETVIDNFKLEHRHVLNQRKSRLDLDGGASYAGLAGTDPGPLVPARVRRLEDRDTMLDAFEDGAISWYVALNLEIPLGKSSRQARVEPTRLRLSQEVLRLSALKSEVRLEVETAFRTMDAEWSRLQIARKATEISQEQFDLQKRNMEAGLATAVQYLETQRAFADTLDFESASRLSYRLARSRLSAASAAGFEEYTIAID